MFAGYSVNPINMANFLPVIGELYTVVKSGLLLTGAGVAKLIGNNEKADEMFTSAGEAWKECSETSLIAALVNMAVQTVSGHKERRNEIFQSFVGAAETCANGTPVVGHAKGLYHYATGDKAKGNACMEAATRTTAVIGAGAVTGGAGAGLAVGAGVGIGAGIGFDTAATGVDMLVNGDDAHLHGTMNLTQAGDMKPKEIVDSLLGIALDAAAGAGGNQLGKNVQSYRSGQQSLQKTFQSSKEFAKTGLDPADATRVTMNAAEASKKGQAALSKPTKHATSLVEDSATGKKGVGNSEAYRRQTRTDNFKEKGFDSKAKAAKAKGFDDPSHLQTKHPEVEQVLERPQKTCAEHEAFDNLAEKNPNYDTRNINTATVYNEVESIRTKRRCDNCQGYGDAMGTVLTDLIPDGTNVPDCGYVEDGRIKRATTAASTAIRDARRSKNDKHMGMRNVPPGLNTMSEPTSQQATTAAGSILSRAMDPTTRRSREREIEPLSFFSRAMGPTTRRSREREIEPLSFFSRPMGPTTRRSREREIEPLSFFSRAMDPTTRRSREREIEPLSFLSLAMGPSTPRSREGKRKSPFGFSLQPWAQPLLED
jgi:hypothetical protein